LRRITYVVVPFSAVFRRASRKASESLMLSFL
jgi:hypothetical protein